MTSSMRHQSRRSSETVHILISSAMDTVEFSGNADFEWAVQLNRFSLNFIGLWPQGNVGLRERLNSDFRMFGVFGVITCLCTTPMLHSLIKIWGDITAMIDNMLFTLPLLVLSIKMLVIWWKKESLSSLVTMIAHDWIKSKSDIERNVMVRRARNARIIITVSYVLAITTISVLVVVSGFGYTLRHVNITGTGRLLPLQANYIYDTSASPQFELTFIMQGISLMLVAFSYMGINNFLGLLIFHICGQLENLTNRLYRMRKSNDFIEALKLNIKDHLRLIRFVEIIENSFTFMLLVLFVYFGILAIVYGFLIVVVIFEEEKVSAMRVTFLIMVIINALISMCVYCAIGELLVAKYEDVYNAICECEWYTLETKQAKSLILLMVRTNKPLYITAGKLLPMTMSTFCNILKTSGGYISVLLTHRN